MTFYNISEMACKWITNEFIQILLTVEFIQIWDQMTADIFCIAQVSTLSIVYEW